MPAGWWHRAQRASEDLAMLQIVTQVCHRPDEGFIAGCGGCAMLR
jgi:hypothetical protein